LEEKGESIASGSAWVSQAWWAEESHHRDRTKAGSLKTTEPKVSSDIRTRKIVHREIGDDAYDERPGRQEKKGVSIQTEDLEKDTSAEEGQKSGAESYGGAFGSAHIAKKGKKMA